jgi:hypothetical protein
MTSALGALSSLNQYQGLGAVSSNGPGSLGPGTAVAVPYAKLMLQLVQPGVWLSAVPMDPKTVPAGATSGTPSSVAGGASTKGGTINVTA